MQSKQQFIPGQKYCTKDGKKYQILTIGRHVDTGEEMLVFQGLFEPFAVYIKTLSQVAVASDTVPEVETKISIDKKKDEKELSNSKEKNVEDLFIQFLDETSSKRKLEILMQMKPDLDLRLINNIAASMDLPADNENIQEQFEFIAENLKQRAKFEIDRFR